MCIQPVRYPFESKWAITECQCKVQSSFSYDDAKEPVPLSAIAHD